MIIIIINQFQHFIKTYVYAYAYISMSYPDAYKMHFLTCESIVHTLLQFFVVVVI